MAKPKKKDKDPKFTKLDQRIYENVIPFGYSNKPGVIATAAKNIIRNKGDRETVEPQREELWKYALGSSDPLEHFQTSNYVPSKSTDPSAKYLSPKDLDKSAHGLNQFMAMLGSKDKVVRNDLPVTEESMKALPKGQWAGNMLGNFTVSKGEDEKGTYISVYDKWDLANKQANKMLDRKPEIYDRIYYQDNPHYIKAQEFKKRIDAAKGDNSKVEEYKAVLKEHAAYRKEHGLHNMLNPYNPVEQEGEIEEFSTGGILASVGKGAASGALSGSALPGLGTLAGGIIGGAAGLFKGIMGHKQEKANEEAMHRQERMADILANRQDYFDEQANMVNESGTTMIQNQYAPTFCKGGKVRKMPTGGFVDSKLVELEDGETFKSPDGTVGVTSTSAPTHEEGGVPINLEVGTRVIGDDENIDTETGMTFRKSGRQIAAMNKKYTDLLENSRGTFTRNAAEAMLRKADQKFDDTYERQESLKPDEERETEKFFNGGAIGAWLNSLKNPAVDGSKMGGLGSLLGGGDPTQITAAGAGVAGMVPVSDQKYGLSFGEKLKGMGGFFGGDGIGGLLNAGAQLAPVGYNLIQGMQPAHQQTASDFYNPEYDRALRSQQGAVDLLANRRADIEPQLEANRNAQAMHAYNTRTQGGLDAGAIAANRLAGTAGRMRADMSARQWQQSEQNRLRGEHAGGLSQLGQMQAGLGAGRAATNLRVDENNLAAQAARRNMMGTGFGQMSQYAQMQQLMQNQQGSDQQRLQILQGMEPMFNKWFGNLTT